MGTVNSNNNIDIKETRKFGVTMTVVFGLFFAFFFWRDHKTLASICAVLSIAFLLLQISPFALATAKVVWMKFAHAIGWFNTRLLLTLVYFLLVTPTGLVMRLLGKTPIDKRFRTNDVTSFNHAHTNHDYKKTY